MTATPHILWQAYSTDETDEDVRAHAARKLGVSLKDVELRRTGGCVLAQVREKSKEHEREIK